jgi:urease accessory protein
VEIYLTPPSVEIVRRGERLVHGLLDLVFTYDASRAQTILQACAQQPPLRVVRAFPLPDGGKLVHLHNLSGGVLGGDALELHVEVAADAYAQLTTVGATRVYRCLAEVVPASQLTTIHVGARGLLEYLPDPLIPFAGSRYRQETHITLEDGAGLFWWETVAPGRLARGECFAYDLLQINFKLSIPTMPLAIERFTLEPQRQSLSALVRLGPYRYFGSFYICRVGLEAARWMELERSLSVLADKLTQVGETLWGVSTLVAHGLVVRYVSRQGLALPSGLLAFWQEARRALYGREAVLPRKIY